MSGVVEYEYTVCRSKSLSRVAKAYLEVLPPEVKTLCVSGSSGVAGAAAMMAIAISGARTQEWHKITLFARWLRRAFGQKEVLVVKTQAVVETI